MEDSDDFIFLLNVVIVCYTAFLVTLDFTAKQKGRKRRRKRSVWIRHILRKRNEEGTHSILLPKLLCDDAHYRNFLRMSKEDFALLLAMVEPALVRNDTVMRASISVSERLALTLRYLATGPNRFLADTFYNLSTDPAPNVIHTLHKETLSKIVSIEILNFLTSFIH